MANYHIAFTGHRDKILSDKIMNDIVRGYGNEDYVWVHGGARGFDKQVNDFAERNGISQYVIYPEYDKYDGKVAPLLRNKKIVDMSDVVIACYDGRGKGGTYYTIDLAKKLGKPVIIFNPDIKESVY